MPSLWHRKILVGGMLLLSAGATRPAYAHCDTMDGPVVTAARRALKSGNVNYALFWVRAEDEGAIRSAFRRTLRARDQSAAAREIADLWFYETLVRVHREGEGAPYTGIKPAGTEEHPAISAADSALARGSIVELEKLLTHALHDGLRVRFQAALAAKDFRLSDVAAGRAYVQAYVPLIHYVEAMYDLARGVAEKHVNAAEENR